MRSWVLSLMVVATKNIHPTLLLFASDYANDKIFCWVQSILHEYVKKVTQPWQTITILSFFQSTFLTCCIDYTKEIQVSIFWIITFMSTKYLPLKIWFPFLQSFTDSRMTSKRIFSVTIMIFTTTIGTAIASQDGGHKGGEETTKDGRVCK